MTELTFKNGVPQYTLEHFEKDYADRHLLHGIIAKWAKEKPDGPALIVFDTKKEYSYARFDQITTALAMKLLKMGFSKGDFLATMLPFLAEHIFLETSWVEIAYTRELST